MKTLSLVAATVLLSLSACDKEEEVHTTDWYAAHNAERHAKIQECKNNPGELKNTPNCINAYNGHELKRNECSNEMFQKMPPLPIGSVAKLGEAAVDEYENSRTAEYTRCLGE
ncbi:MAG: EexN family lipoprotein [Azoarcus sp.]|jgi:hypothetical protein|nr:EexN family lipoprotein [Azoarcus sp.]